MEISSFIIILAVGMIGGFFNVFVGAGSLLTIPALILLGLPPHTAIATNRLGVTGSDIAGWYEFHKKRMIDYRAALLLAVPALIGSVIGANLMLEIDEGMLKKIVATVTLAILLLITFRPEAGIFHSQKKIKGMRRSLALLAGFSVGIYGGFYGAGAGTFLFYILILSFGETFIESAGTHAPANLAFSLTAAVIFAYNGVIDYIWTLPLFIGSFAGSYLSAYHVKKIKNIWLKKIFFGVVLILVVKLLI